MKKYKILIVEDNADFREILADFFKSYNFDILEAENGTQAYELFTHEKIDCILSDIIMPECSGIELANKVFSHDKPVPLALMSGYTDQGDLDNIKNSPFWISYFNKPFDEKKLIEKINEKLKHINDAHT